MSKTLVTIVGLIMMLTAKDGIQAAEPQEEQIEVFIHRVQQNIVKIGLASGVDAYDAYLAMKEKANELDIDLISRLEVSRAMNRRGVEARYLEILQFCVPQDAIKLVMHNPLFSAFLPCRISIVEDQHGKLWLYMVNLDMEIDSRALPPELQQVAIRINQKMLAILTAGVTGGLNDD